VQRIRELQRIPGKPTEREENRGPHSFWHQRWASLKQVLISYPFIHPWLYVQSRVCMSGSLQREILFYALGQVASHQLWVLIS
jgi:hypothetical protein